MNQFLGWAVTNRLSDFGVALVYLVFRATLLWVGAKLADMPALGLPEIGWVQAFGIVVGVRATLTHVVCIRQVEQKVDLERAHKALDQFANAFITSDPFKQRPEQSEGEDNR